MSLDAQSFDHPTEFNMLEGLKEEVCHLNIELPANNLVVWTSGNVSVRDSKTGYVVIKPSGVKFDDLEPGKMVVGWKGCRRDFECIFGY